MTEPGVQELPYWEADPEAFDTVFLAGRPLPGIARVSPIERELKTDDKSAKGKNKGPLTLQGEKRAEFEIELEIHGRDEWRALQEWWPELEPVHDKEKATDKDAWDISHPFTALRSVEAIIITKRKGPEIREGFLYVTLKVVEFDRPTATKATGIGGAASGGLKIGFFADQTGALLPSSYVAIEGPQAKDDKGLPLKTPYGDPVYVCQQLAVAMGPDSMNSVAATFLGRYHSPDPLLKMVWDAFEDNRKAAKDDATTTPDASAGGGANNPDGASDDAATPAPSETDAAP